MSEKRRITKEKMKDLIDSENGKGFSKNIDLSGYSFFKNNSFISFRITKVQGVNIVHIKYFYAENKEELISILAYASNFWMGYNIKFIYYKEKKKKPYVTKIFKNLGFKVNEDPELPDWKHSFECSIHGKEKCNCSIIEVYN